MMKKYRPSAHGLNIIRLMLIIASIAVVIASRRYLSSYPIVMYTAIGVFCSLAFIAGMIVLPIIFAKSYYTVSDDEIQKLSGMFVIRRQYMRSSAVQYITTITTPFSSLTGLNFVIVNALGGHITMLFLSKKDLLEVTAYLHKLIRLNNEKQENEKQKLQQLQHRKGAIR